MISAEDADGLRTLQEEKVAEESQSQAFGHLCGRSSEGQQNSDGRAVPDARMDGRRRRATETADCRHAQVHRVWP